MGLWKGQKTWLPWWKKRDGERLQLLTSNIVILFHRITFSRKKQLTYPILWRTYTNMYTYILEVERTRNSGKIPQSNLFLDTKLFHIKGSLQRRGSAEEQTVNHEDFSTANSHLYENQYINWINRIYFFMHWRYSLHLIYLDLVERLWVKGCIMKKCILLDKTWVWN